MEKCPKCGENMLNKGNISGVVYTSYPAQWDDVYVCEKCLIKKTIRVHGQHFEKPNFDNFTEA